MPRRSGRSPRPPAAPDPAPQVDLADLTRDLEALRDDALAAIAAAPDLATLEALEVDILGKKGRLTVVSRGIGALPAEDRPKVGAVANPVRAGDRGRLRRRAAACSTPRALEARLAAEAVDVTTPGRPVARGTLHPSIEAMREIADIFGRFGFVVYESPEIEDDVTNFQMLNIPPDHPARDLWDTLYVDLAGSPPADPHLARPDPGDAVDRAADPGAPPGPLLPLRGGRRVARLRVLPGRGPDGRRGHDHGRPARPARRVRPGDVRGAAARPASGPATTRSPSRRSRSTSSAWSAAGRAARPAAGPAG